MRCIVVILLIMAVGLSVAKADEFCPAEVYDCTSPEYRAQLVQIVSEETKNFNVDPCEVWAILSKESTFNHWYPSGKVKKGDGGRSIGAGQLNTGWGKKFGLDLYDLRDNVKATCTLIVISRDEYGYHLEKRFAWYNGGGRGMRSKAARRYAKDACNRYEKYLAEYVEFQISGCCNRTCLKVRERGTRLRAAST